MYSYSCSLFFDLFFVLFFLVFKHFTAYAMRVVPGRAQREHVVSVSEYRPTCRLKVFFFFFLKDHIHLGCCKLQ